MKVSQEEKVTQITVRDENKVITVCNKTKTPGAAHWLDSPQLYIEDEDGSSSEYANLEDEEIDELIKALERSKKVKQ